MSDFKSLLSVFQDATGCSAPSSSRNASSASTDGGGAILSPSSTATKPKANDINLESTTDPNFSSSIMKQRIERLLRIQQIRKSTATSNISKSPISVGDQRNKDESFHLAVCATIVDDFPHEELWKRWMSSTTIDIPKTHIETESKVTKISCSAELYVHAKHPQKVHSSYLKTKLLSFSHTPNWNDVRVIRAMLSLLQQALEEKKTTHVLFCTESCVPIVTLGEAASSILLNEVCVWEEKETNKEVANTAADDNDHDDYEVDDRKEEKLNSQQLSLSPKQTPHQHRLSWDRSYIYCYNQNSPQCTRFDEHNCWSILSNSIPTSAIYKALPGWCLLSRKHAQCILDLPEKQLGGMNLWPAFERVWAPEEVYFPTALSLCGYMDDDDEVLKRSLMYSEWDTRASNHKDRAHPLTFDDNFDYTLVRRVRSEKNGALFIRKVKRKLDLNIWEEIVIRREKGHTRKSSQKRRAPSPSSSMMRSGYNDDYKRRDNNRDRGRHDYRERNDKRFLFDSRTNRFNDRYN